MINNAMCDFIFLEDMIVRVDDIVAVRKDNGRVSIETTVGNFHTDYSIDYIKQLITESYENCTIRIDTVGGD